MSRSIDERVVEMRFDNSNFERNVQTSMSTLDRLKMALNLDGATRGLENIEAAAKNTNLSYLGEAVSTVKEKFSALEVMAITALANITNEAINAGKHLVRSFTLEPIQQGFEEYELKMNAIQTMMASTGEDIEVVNKYLEELNTYADKTIYSFSDMTQNIGKFTNSGVKLKDAVKAIQGISNEAAVSGANTNEASRAMYNFAQALSSGSVKLIDWKSIELANMATVEFKNALLDTALAMGTVVKENDKYRTTTTDVKGHVSDLFDATENFNNSLNNQWMTTEVLIQTLSNYSTDIRDMTDEEVKAYEEKLRAIGYTEEQIKAIEKLGIKAFDAAQKIKTFTQLIDTMKEAIGTGWSETFELIIGDEEEAKELWTDVGAILSGFIDKMSKSRNETLKTWKELGGRTSLLDGIKNIFDGLLSVIEPITKAFNDIFPPLTAQHLLEITEGFKNLTANFKLNETASKNLRSTFKGLFSIVDIVCQAIGALIRLFLPATKGIDSLGGGILAVTGYIGDWITVIDEWIKKNEIFTKAIDKVHEIIGPVFGAIENAIDGAIQSIKAFAGIKFVTPNIVVIENFFDKLQEAFEPLKKLGDQAKEHLLKTLNSIKDAFSELFSNGEIFKNIENFFSKLRESFFSFGDFVSVLKTLVIDAFNAIVDTIKKFISNMNKVLDKSADVFKQLSTKGSSLISEKDLVDLTNAGIFGVLVALFKKFVDTFKKAQTDIASAVVTTLGSVRDVLKTYQNDLRAEILKNIAISIAILAGSLWVLSTIPAEKLQPAGVALGAIAFGFGVITSAIAKINSSGNLLNMANASVYLLAMATSMLILAAAVKKFEGMDVDTIGAATVSLWILAETLTKMTEVFSRLDEDSISNLIKIGNGMLIISASMAVLSFSIYKLAQLKPEKMFQGLVGVIVGISAMAASMRIIGDNAKDMPVVGAGMLLIAAAMTLLLVPITALGLLPLPTIAQGLIAVLGALFGISLISLVASKAIPGLMSLATSLIGIAAGMTLLTIPITVLGLLPLPTVAQGLIAILAALLGFSLIGLVANGAAPGLIILATTLTLMAFGMTLLVAPITALGALPLPTVAQGLGMILGALLGYTIIGYIATGAAAGLLALGGSLLMISGAILIAGVGMTALGVGVMLLGNALMNLAKMSPGAAQNVVDSITTIIKGAISLVPEIAKAFGEGAIMIAKTIADSAPAVADAINTIIAEIIAVVISSKVTIYEGLLVMIEGLLEALSKHGPAIANYLISFLTDIFTILRDRIAEITRPFMQFLDELFKVVAEELEKMDFSNLRAILENIASLSDILKSLAGLSVLGPLATLGIIDLVSAVGLLTIVLTALGAIYQIPGLMWFVEQGGEFLAAIGEAIGNFIGSITGAFLEGVANQLPKMGQDLSKFMLNLQPFILGATMLSSETMSGVRSLAETILILTAANILDGMTRWFAGGTSLVKFGLQLKEFGKPLAEFAYTVSGVKAESVEGAASAAKMMVEVAKMVPNDKSNSWAGLFTGTNNINDFGKKLLYFGYYIANFAETVENVTAEAVEGAVRAGAMMASVAKMVPNDKSNSWAGLFTGTNNIDNFGKQLLYFGHYLVAFAEKVTDVTPESVEGAANATKMLAEVAEMVPKSEGIFESILHGNNNIDQFGAMLESFGRSLKSFYEEIQGIAVTQLAVVINDVRSLIDLINGMKGIDASGTGQFVTGLKNLADAGIDNFVKAFNGSYSKAQTTVSNFINTVSSAFTNYSASLVKTATGIGTNVTTALSTGIQNGITSVSNSAKRIGTEVINAMQDALPNWKLNQIGRDFCRGVADGINDNTRFIYNAAWDAANEAYEAAMDALDINSPSKVGAAIGKFWDLGIAGGMNEYSAKIGEASDGIAEEMMKIQTLSLDDYEPKIRPVLDLSNAKMATDTVNENLALDINPQLENLSGITNLLGAEINSGFSGLKDAFGSQSASIVEVIDRLRTDVNALSEKVDGLQIVMDTGTLVGELAPGMNMRLGQMATYSGRRM